MAKNKIFKSPHFPNIEVHVSYKKSYLICEIAKKRSLYTNIIDKLNNSCIHDCHSPPVFWLLAKDNIHVIENNVNITKLVCLCIEFIATRITSSLVCRPKKEPCSVTFNVFQRLSCV